MSGKTYTGNSAGKAKIPKKIYIGDDDGLARLVDSIYVGDGQGIARKVWPVSNLPASFQELQFIRNSTQTTYISTGIDSISNYTTLFYDFAVNEYRNTAYTSDDMNSPVSCMSFMKSQTATYLYGIVSPSSGSLKMMIPYDTESSTDEDKYYKTVATVNYSIGERHTVLFNQTGGKFLYDDVEVGSTDATYSYTQDRGASMPLFGFKTYTNRYYGGPKIDLYHFSAWQNGTLIRDMYPAKRKSDDVIGMYDTVNDTFYGPAGSGTFYPGPNV